jgi:hypothetical protein
MRKVRALRQSVNTRTEIGVEVIMKDDGIIAIVEGRSVVVDVTDMRFINDFLNAHGRHMLYDLLIYASDPITPFVLDQSR